MGLHKFWLKISGVLVASFAPILFLGTMEATMEPARFSMDLLAWPIDGEQTYASGDVRFLSALTGGFLLGWGVLIWGLSGRIYDAEPESVRRVVVFSFLSWFVLDSAGSYTSGNISNVLFNIVVLLAFVGPLWVPAKP